MQIERSVPVIARVLPVLLLLGVGVLLLRALFPFGSPGDRVTIEGERTSDPRSRRASVGATSVERFGGGPAAASHDHDHGDEAEPQMHWDVPEGWEELPATNLRLANLRPSGDSDSECYLTILGGTGGGLAANVNRWRAQIGLQELDPAAIAALPVAMLLDEPATLVDFEGTYSGMGGAPREAWAMLGAIQIREQITVFVKMTGPADSLRTERARFEEFCASLHIDETAAAHAEVDTGPVHSSDTGTQGTGEGPLAFKLPEGWSDVGPGTMRVVNLMASAKTPCYVALLGGEAGGLLANINRWRAEMSTDPLTAAEVEALPKVNLLGEPCPLLDVSGEFLGKGAEAGAGQTLLGSILIRPSASVFVKMVGPAEEVDAARDEFMTFVKSLKER